MKEHPSQHHPEPWLRGAIPGIEPLVMPMFFSFAQVREDLAKHTRGLAEEQIWKPTAHSSLGFQLKHLAGSVDRITTYLMGSQLSPAQLEFLTHESEPGTTLISLLALVEQSLSNSEARLKQIDPISIYQPRVVGRRALPTTVIGLLVHLAEHTQRHLGQAITIIQILRQTG